MVILNKILVLLNDYLLTGNGFDSHFRKINFILDNEVHRSVKPRVSNQHFLSIYGDFLQLRWNAPRIINQSNGFHFKRRFGDIFFEFLKYKLKIWR